MTLKEVKAMAKGMGIKLCRKNKTQLIREIQEREGNIPCFGTERVKFCGEEGCLWRSDCLKEFRKNQK